MEPDPKFDPRDRDIRFLEEPAIEETNRIRRGMDLPPTPEQLKADEPHWLELRAGMLKLLKGSKAELKKTLLSPSSDPTPTQAPGKTRRAIAPSSTPSE